MKTYNVAVFDFDGTLTTKDSFLEFIIFTRGRTVLFFSFFLFLPQLVLMKMGLYSNEKAKQKVFSFCFKGMSADDFEKCGHAFMHRIETFVRPGTIVKLREHLSRGDKVYVVSASVTDWIQPWCESNGIENVVGTEAEKVDGQITGRFLGRNCYGAEKVRRFLQREPFRDNYYLFAYGDSRGDNELLQLADFGQRV